MRLTVEFLREEVGECFMGLLHPRDSMQMGESFGKGEEFNILRNVGLVVFEVSMRATSCGLRQSLDQFILQLD